MEEKQNSKKNGKVKFDYSSAIKGIAKNAIIPIATDNKKKNEKETKVNQDA